MTLKSQNNAECFKIAYLCIKRASRPQEGGKNGRKRTFLGKRDCPERRKKAPWLSGPQCLPLLPGLPEDPAFCAGWAVGRGPLAAPGPTGVGFTCGLPPTHSPCWRLAGRSTPVVNLFITDERKIIHSLWPQWSGCEAGCRVKARVGGGGCPGLQLHKEVGSGRGAPRRALLPLEPGVGVVRAPLHWILPCVETEREGGSPCPWQSPAPGPALRLPIPGPPPTLQAPHLLPPLTLPEKVQRSPAAPCPPPRVPPHPSPTLGRWAELRPDPWDAPEGCLPISLSGARPGPSLEAAWSPHSETGAGRGPEGRSSLPTGLSWPLLGAVQPGVSTLAKGQPVCVGAQHPACRAQGGPG